MTDLHGISASDFAKWRVPCCFYLAEKVEDLDKAVGLELWQPYGAQADRSVWHGEREARENGPRRGPHTTGLGNVAVSGPLQGPS